MTRVVLDATTTASLERTTVHQQFNGEALGVMVLNHLVPIVLNVPQIGGGYCTRVLVWKRLTQKHIPYRDLGEIEACCMKVIGFNLRHYIKCYLSSPDPEPYTYNLCQKCNVAINDDNGHTLGKIAYRKYRRNRYIYRPCEALQDEAGAEDVFGYQDRAISRTC